MVYEGQVRATARTDSNMTYRYTINASGQPIYEGEAPAGSATSAAVWRIRRYTYDATTSGVTKIDFADGDANYNNIFDNASSLTYS